MPSPNRMAENQPGNGHHDEPPALPGISPIVPGRPGRPSFSLEALRELVERQFQEETSDRVDILSELDTDQKRRDLIGEITDYVLAVEAVTLAGPDRTRLVERACRSLFGFGPLDDYIRQDNVTEITVNGPHEIHVRHGLGALERVPDQFDDRAQLASILRRVIASAGSTLSDSEPFLEIGVTLMDRPVRLSIAAPPVSPEYNIEIRLHPRQPITLDALQSQYQVLPPAGTSLLKAFLAAGHGLLIVGDVGLGKTTLASALLASLGDATVSVVERAAEMRPRAQARRQPAKPSAPDQPASDFGAQILAALESQPDWLVVDEIRGDEAAAIWSALTHTSPPRYLWVFRGDSQPDRLRSALNMAIRRQHPTLSAREIATALARHLPFIITLARHGDQARADMIAEVNLVEGETEDDASLRFFPLLTGSDQGWQLTGHHPQRDLGLPDGFWSQAG